MAPTGRPGGKVLERGAGAEARLSRSAHLHRLALRARLAKGVQVPACSWHTGYP